MNRTSEYLRPRLATPGQALGYADLGETEAGHHGESPLRASALDVPNEVTQSSQKAATQQAAGNVPAAIQRRYFPARNIMTMRAFRLIYFSAFIFVLSFPLRSIAVEVDELPDFFRESMHFKAIEQIRQEAAASNDIEQLLKANEATIDLFRRFLIDHKEMLAEMSSQDKAESLRAAQSNAPQNRSGIRNILTYVRDNLRSFASKIAGLFRSNNSGSQSNSQYDVLPIREYNQALNDSFAGVVSERFGDQYVDIYALREANQDPNVQQGGAEYGNPQGNYAELTPEMLDRLRREDHYMTLADLEQINDDNNAGEANASNNQYGDLSLIPDLEPTSQYADLPLALDNELASQSQDLPQDSDGIPPLMALDDGDLEQAANPVSQVANAGVVANPSQDNYDDTSDFVNRNDTASDSSSDDFENYVAPDVRQYQDIPTEEQMQQILRENREAANTSESTTATKASAAASTREKRLEADAKRKAAAEAEAKREAEAKAEREKEKERKDDNDDDNDDKRRKK